MTPQKTQGHDFLVVRLCYTDKNAFTVVMKKNEWNQSINNIFQSM